MHMCFLFYYRTFIDFLSKWVKAERGAHVFMFHYAVRFNIRPVLKKINIDVCKDPLKELLSPNAYVINIKNMVHWKGMWLKVTELNLNRFEK